MDCEREELLSVLADAYPAVGAASVVPSLSCFWFTGKYVYAYDGGLGIRIAYRNELDCGVPGKVLMDLLRTSALKQVSLKEDGGSLVLQMGKARLKLASHLAEQRMWPFPDKPGKKTAQLTLSEELFEALTQVKFVRVSKATQNVHHGVVFHPYKGGVDLYATDSYTIARTSVKEKTATGVPAFILPWAFAARVLEMVEPGAVLHVAEDHLMVEGKEVQLCSNLIELPEAPDLPKVIDRTLKDDLEPIELPGGLQPILDRAAILAGQSDEPITVAVKGNALNLSGKFPLGSIEESLTLKTKSAAVSGRFRVDLLRRGLDGVDNFTLSDTALALYGGEDFVYLVSLKHGK